MSETKPTADLEFEYVFEGTAAQTTTMTVLGESVNLTAADQTIEVNVSATTMNSLITVGAQATPGIGYPAVTVNFHVLSIELNSAYDLFKTVDPDLPGTTFPDASALGYSDTLQKVFASETFSFAASPLSSIPIESVKKVDYSGALTLTNSDDETAAVLVPTGVGLSGGLLPPSLTAGNEEALIDEKEIAVRSLYLQALAADKYRAASAPATGTQPTSQASSSGFVFAVGDVVSFFTKLSLTKTRKFIPDPASTSAKTAELKFAVDGSDVVIGDADVEDDKYNSDPLDWTIRWKVVVA
jgi:hypothetical protein